MHKAELAQISIRLSQLAEALSGRAPSAAGLLVWGDVLQECRIDDVSAALTDWPKRFSKMPTPSDILKACRDSLSRRIEETARKNAASAYDAFDPATLPARSKAAREERAAIKEALAMERPAPKDWARRLQIRHEMNEPLSTIQIANYRAALRLGL
jgi:hypothetical protein